MAGDNCTVSGTTLTNEFVQFCRYYALTPQQVVQLIDDGFRSSFARPDIRRALRRGAVLDTLRILKQAGVDIAPAVTALTPFHADILYRPLPLPKEQAGAITADNLAALPKADVGVYFVGSVPLATVVEEILRLSDEEKSALEMAPALRGQVTSLRQVTSLQGIASLEDLMAVAVSAPTVGLGCDCCRL